MPNLPLCYLLLNVLKGRNCVTDVKSSDNIGEGIITVGMYRLKA